MKRFLGLMIARVLLVAAGFAAAACFGGWPMVGNIVGFIVVRTVVVTRSHIKGIAALEASRMKHSGKRG